MKHPIPTDTELLVELAAQADLDYQDAYYIWAQVHQQEDAYLVVETVLYVARMHRLPICLAMIACQMRPNWPINHPLTEWIPA